MCDLGGARRLLGVANRSDALLAVWPVRARDLVPRLTEQTTSVHGFQIMLGAGSAEKR